MRVRLTCWRTAGYGGAQRPGTVIDVNEEEAAALVKMGSAEPLAEAAEAVETAMVAPRRNAALPRPKPKAKR